MKQFSDLGELMEDDTCPMGTLIDLAILEVYGDIELDPFVSCEYDDTLNLWEFHVRMSENDTLRLIITSDFCISFFCNTTPLHFNQAPLYAKLYAWEFIEVSE